MNGTFWLMCKAPLKMSKRLLKCFQKCHEEMFPLSLRKITGNECEVQKCQLSTKNTFLVVTVVSCNGRLPREIVQYSSVIVCKAQFAGQFEI